MWRIAGNIRRVPKLANLTIMKMLTSRRKMKVSRGSDACVAPAKCVDDFHGNHTGQYFKACFEKNHELLLC